MASVSTYTQTGTASSGSTTVALGATTNVAVGQAVSGTGIGYATSVTAINTPSANDITISVPTTSALSGVTLTFSGLGITLSAATTTGEQGPNVTTVWPSGPLHNIHQPRQLPPTAPNPPQFAHRSSLPHSLTPSLPHSLTLAPSLPRSLTPSPRHPLHPSHLPPQVLGKFDQTGSGIGPFTQTTATLAASGATTIPMSAVTNVAKAQEVSGTGVPYGTTVTNIAGSTITISAALTAAITSGSTLTFASHVVTLVNAQYVVLNQVRCGAVRCGAVK